MLTRYMPIIRPRGGQLKPQPQSRTAAEMRPASGSRMAIRLAILTRSGTVSMKTSLCNSDSGEESLSVGRESAMPGLEGIELKGKFLSWKDGPPDPIETGQCRHPVRRG